MSTGELWYSLAPSNSLLLQCLLSTGLVSGVVGAIILGGAGLLYLWWVQLYSSHSVLTAIFLFTSSHRCQRKRGGTELRKSPQPSTPPVCLVELDSKVADSNTPLTAKAEQIEKGKGEEKEEAQDHTKGTMTTQLKSHRGQSLIGEDHQCYYTRNHTVYLYIYFCV